MTVSEQKKNPQESADNLRDLSTDSAYIPGFILLAQAGEGAGLSPTQIGIIIGVIVAIIVLYAIVRALRRPDKPEITQRREPTPEDRVPTKDVLEDRMEVEGPVEITDDMSLADIKRAKAARVTSKTKAVRRETSKEANERARREREEAEKAAKEAEESADSADKSAARAEEAALDAEQAAEAAAEKVKDVIKAEAESLADAPEEEEAPAAQESAEPAADEEEAETKPAPEAPKAGALPAPKLKLKKPEIAPSLEEDSEEKSARPSFKLPKPKGKPEEEQKAAVEPALKAPAESGVEEPLAGEPVSAEPPVEAVEKVEPAAPAAEPPPVEEAPAEDEPKSLAQGLAKTRTGFIGRLSGLFSGDHLSDDMIDEVEEILFTADIGPHVAQGILDAVEKGLSGEEKQDPARIWGFIREYSSELLKSHEKPLTLDEHKPFVMIVVGVNGAGKTTTIGKLASKYRADGKKVLLVAGDTFRAGAVDQLAVWADRTGIPIHEGADEADPSSVLFAGIERGIEEEMDVIICDTSGRLQTNVNLMDELAKMARVAGKALDGAPHETMLVLDANTGQNAIIQAEKFNEAVQITGITLTKLDGTARGGVILGICDRLDAPMRYIGIGESVEDLRAFDADEFVDALFM